jgi:hypothetical protein
MNPKLTVCLFLAGLLLLPTMTIAEDGTGTTAPAPAAAEDKASPEEVANTDPRRGEAPVPAENGWNGFLILDNEGVGVWSVASYQVFPQFGCPEVVGIDDRGRCHVMAGYSGRWMKNTVVDDGAWLGGLAHGDVDPRIPGSELYTGGVMGHLWQVITHRHDRLEPRLLHFFPGLELQTIVAGDFDASHKGSELLVFTNPPAVYLVTPDGPHGAFNVRKLADLPGLVRSAVVLPPDVPGGVQQVACASRDGALRLLGLDGGAPHWTTVHAGEMGVGRVARWTPIPGSLVLYSTLDDGRILRHEQPTGQKWKTETIFLGPQGPRGIASGRFHPDPTVESVAIFGYAKKVQLLTRGEGGWTAETIYTDADKGHWIAVAEVDGRNATDELICSGFGGRIVLLTRPVGYGRSEPSDD